MNHSNPRHYLAERHYRAAWAAANLAANRGQQFDAAFHIHWSLAGGPGGGTWQDRQKRLLEHLGLWIERRGGPWVCLWVNEAHLQGKETHLHALIHVPPAISYGDLESYLRAQLNAPHDPTVLVFTRCADYLRGWRGGVTYLTKTVPPELWEKLQVPIGLRKKARESSGPIRGKRMGMSRSIGPAAQRWAALRPSRTAAGAQVLVGGNFHPPQRKSLSRAAWRALRGIHDQDRFKTRGGQASGTG